MNVIFDENKSTMGIKPNNINNNKIVKRKAKNPLQDRTNNRNSLFSPSGKGQKTMAKKRLKTSQQQQQQPQTLQGHTNSRNVFSSSNGKVQKKTTTTKLPHKTSQLQPFRNAFSSPNGKGQKKTTKKVTDIDKGDHKDPLAATEYVVEIYQELRKREVKMSPQPNYIVSQPNIQSRYVSIVIDWLIEVQTRFGGHDGERLSRETLYLAANLIHNFLAKSKVIKSEELQLVGVTAFLIASKYEDIDPPMHCELERLCDNAYSSQDFLDMEERILKTLDYSVSAPSALNFLHRFLKAANATQEMNHIANYMLDSTLLSYSLLEFLPSQLAAAAVYIANRKAKGCRRAPWKSVLTYHTGQKESEVLAVAKSIFKANNEEIPLARCESVHNKYAQDHYGEISKKFTFTFD